MSDDSELLAQIAAARKKDDEDLGVIASARGATTPKPSSSPVPAPLPVEDELSVIAAARAKDPEPMESDFGARHPILSAAGKTAKEFAARNVEAIGFNLPPARKLGNKLSPVEDRQIPDPEMYPAKTGPSPENYSPLKESLGEVAREFPERIQSTVATIPGLYGQFAVAGKIAALSGLSRVASAVSAPMARGLGTLTKYLPDAIRGSKVLSGAGTALATEGPKEAATMGTLGFLSGAGEESMKPGSTLGSMAKAGAKMGAVMAPTGPLFAAGGGALRGAGQRAAIRNAEKELAGTDVRFATRDDLFEHFRSRGVPDADAVLLTEKNETARVFNRLLNEEARIGPAPGPLEASAAQRGAIAEGVPSPYRPRPDEPLPATRAQTEFSKLPEPGIEIAGPTVTPKSLSEAVLESGGLSLAKSRNLPPALGTDTVKGIVRPEGAGLEELWIRMGAKGYDVGSSPDAFAGKLLQDLSSKKAGFVRAGREMPKGYTPKGPTFDEVAESYRALGLPDDVAISQAARGGPKGKMGDDFVPAEAAFKEAKAYELAPGETMVTTKNGVATTTRGEADLGVRDPHMWPSAVARRFPETFGKVFYPFRQANAKLMKIESELFQLKKRWATIPEKRALELGRILQEEDLSGVRMTPFDMAKRGIQGPELDLYSTIRSYLLKTGEAREAMGLGNRNKFTYSPRMWEGQNLVYRVKFNEKGEPYRDIVTRVRDYDEAVAQAKKLLEENPSDALYIHTPVEIPENVIGLLPKQLRKKYLAEVREQVGAEETQVTVQTLAAIQKKPGRFFGQGEQRVKGLETYIQDPRKWFPMYVKQWEKKLLWDAANKEGMQALQTFGKRQEMAKFAAKYMDYANNPTQEIDRIIRTKLSPFGAKVVTRGMALTRQFTSNMFLGYSPMSAILQFSEVLFGTIPQLNPKWAAVGAKEALQTSAGVGKNLKLNQRILEEVGVGDAFQSSDVIAKYGEMSRLGKLEPMWLFKRSDAGAKSLTALGAAHKRLKEGASIEEAIRFAAEKTDQIHYHTSPVDAPPILRSEVAQTLMQFSGYPLKQIEYFANLTPKEKAVYATMVSASVGIKGIPFIQDTEAVQEAIVRYPWARGMFAAMGVDVSDSMNPMSWQIPQGDNIIESIPFLSPGIKAPLNLARAAITKDPKDMKLASRGMLPRAMVRVGDAIEQIKTGAYKSPGTGEYIADVSVGDALMMAGGFRPPQIGQARAAQRVGTIREEKAKTQTRRVMEKVLNREELTREEAQIASSASFQRAVAERKLKQNVPLKERLGKKGLKRLRPGMRELAEELE